MSKSKADLKDSVVFKFSLHKTKDVELITYLRGILSKNKRGEWLANAARLYKNLEVFLGTVDYQDVKKFIEDCKAKTSKSQ